jgi:uncharacterized coiled-coil protein SlyX
LRSELIFDRHAMADAERGAGTGSLICYHGKPIGNVADRIRAIMSSSEKEIIELQSRILFQDDVIQKLDEVIIKQGEKLDRLHQRIDALEDKLEQLSFERDQTHTPADEKPPHY